MSYEELIEKIEKAAPELKGKLTLDRVIYKRGSRHAYFYLLSDAVAGDREYLAVQKILKSAFPGIRQSLRIASPSLKDDFLADPDKYAHVINNILLREHPALSAWEFDMRYKAEDGRVVLELPDDFSMQYLKERKLTDKINQAIKDIFCVDTEVICRVSGVREETAARLERERRAEEALMEQRREAARKRDEETQRRREQAEERKRRIVYGRQITEKPVQISELTNDSGAVVIAGKRLDYEEKEISQGEMLLVSFNVTDYTGTIKCKMFLRYRPRFRKEEADEQPPITEEQRKAVQDTVDALKKCEGVQVRGECRYDNFAHECTLMVNAINRYDLPKRMHPEFSKLVQAKCEELERELIPKELFEVFEKNYLEHPMKYRLTRRKIYEESENGRDYVHFKGRMKIGDDSEVVLQGTGNGPIDAFFNALKAVGINQYQFISYSQHAISQGSDSKAVSYIELKKPDGKNIFGIGIDSNVNVASVLGVLNAINRAEAEE